MCVAGYWLNLDKSSNNSIVTKTTTSKRNGRVVREREEEIWRGRYGAERDTLRKREVNSGLSIRSVGFGH